MKKVVFNSIVLVAGLFFGWLSFLVFHSTSGTFGFDTYGFYKDQYSAPNAQDYEIASEFGFEPQNEEIADRIAAKNPIWAARLEKCKIGSPSESLYIMRSIIWGQADKADAKSSGVSDLTHLTRRQVKGGNLDCAIAQGDAVAFILGESRLTGDWRNVGLDLEEPLLGQLSLIDKTLLANVDNWLLKYPIGKACTNLRDPEYFQCGGTPGVLMAYRAALLASVYCTDRKSDPRAISQVEAAWRVAIARSAPINARHYNNARVVLVEAIMKNECPKTTFWLAQFEY